MFNTATLYRITSAMQTAGALDFGARAAEFAPTGPTQVRSIGWVAPREPGGTMAESVAGQIIMAAKVETRSVPPDAITKRVDAMADAIERETGRKPGKKQRRELKDQALLDLLPQAFPKTVQVPVWINPETGLLLVGTASTSLADDIVTLMVQSLAMTMAPLQTQRGAASLMASWLLDGDSAAPFALGTEASLQATDGSGETVRYTHADLEANEVAEHVRNGKAAKSLGLYYLDRVEFVLTDSLALKKITLTAPMGDEAPADAFDADVALATAELSKMIADLIASHGGEVLPEPAEESA